MLYSSNREISGYVKMSWRLTELFTTYPATT
ncbi:hypothetical protein SAMN05444350_11610 [Bacteroides stercorirosoris]|uniref:Uncharacterized protein n=1 Tax=Bacteroides stercorirosoris TaxID=871324 RepID=A0A1M6GRG7_9BACE|nr:hypothetical protein SAMN05444350_11610 [Bacteroides stercorirosoris]